MESADLAEKWEEKNPNIKPNVLAQFLISFLKDVAITK